LSNELVKEAGLPNELVNEAGLPDGLVETLLDWSGLSEGRLKLLVDDVVADAVFCESIIRQFVDEFCVNEFWVDKVEGGEEAAMAAAIAACLSASCVRALE
jgi:hypothetical protein